MLLFLGCFFFLQMRGGSATTLCRRPPSILLFFLPPTAAVLSTAAASHLPCIEEGRPSQRPAAHSIAINIAESRCFHVHHSYHCSQPITVQAPTMRATIGESMKKKSRREVKWENRRRQIYRHRTNLTINIDHREGCFSNYNDADDGDTPASSPSPCIEEKGRVVTDQDLDELKGSMELGFGFDEEKGGQKLCDTLPALDLYFAVNRQLTPEPKVMMRTSTSSSSLPSMSSSTFGNTPSPRSPSLLDSLKICNTGDNPQVVKTRLRHWAQVVACSVKHSS